MINHQHPIFLTAKSEAASMINDLNVAALIDLLSSIQQRLDTADDRTMDLTTRLAAQAQIVRGQAELLAVVVGGTEVAHSLMELYAMLQSNLANDQVTAADLLTRINTTSTLLATTVTNVQLARNVADNAVAATQTMMITLSDQGQKLATNITGLTTANIAISNRLRKDVNDVTLYQLSVPAPVTPTDAVPLSWLTGGVAQPFRIAQNVAASFVTLGDPIVNPFPMGTYVVYIDKIGVVFTTLPAVNTTLTITATVGANTTTVYTRNFLLAGLPLIGNVFDVTGITNFPIPFVNALPVVYKASLTGGAVGTVILSGKLFKNA